MEDLENRRRYQKEYHRTHPQKNNPRKPMEKQVMRIEKQVEELLKIVNRLTKGGKR